MSLRSSFQPFRYVAPFAASRLGLLLRRALRSRGGSPSARAAERKLDLVLTGSPKDHHYRVRAGELVPRFHLFGRARVLSALCPRPVTSLLDIGCCRGYYVLQAARDPACLRAVGIDVYEPSIAAARAAAAHLGIARAAFHVARLDEAAADPAAYGGPFQTILLVGAYHYLYWGSLVSPACYLDHDAILSGLQRLCAGRILLSARLEAGQLPRYLQAKASSSPAAGAYTTDGFLSAARRRFEVRWAGALGKYPIFVLTKKA